MSELDRAAREVGDADTVYEFYIEPTYSNALEFLGWVMGSPKVPIGSRLRAAYLIMTKGKGFGDDDADSEDQLGQLVAAIKGEAA